MGTYYAYIQFITNEPNPLLLFFQQSRTKSVWCVWTSAFSSECNKGRVHRRRCFTHCLLFCSFPGVSIKFYRKLSLYTEEQMGTITDGKIMAEYNSWNDYITFIVFNGEWETRCGLRHVSRTEQKSLGRCDANRLAEVM